MNKDKRSNRMILVILLVFVIIVCVFLFSIFDESKTTEVNAQKTLNETLATLGEKTSD